MFRQRCRFFSNKIIKRSGSPCSGSSAHAQRNKLGPTEKNRSQTKQKIAKFSVKRWARSRCWPMGSSSEGSSLNPSLAQSTQGVTFSGKCRVVWITFRPRATEVLRRIKLKARSVRSSSSSNRDTGWPHSMADSLELKLNTPIMANTDHFQLTEVLITSNYRFLYLYDHFYD